MVPSSTGTVAKLTGRAQLSTGMWSFWERKWMKDKKNPPKLIKPYQVAQVAGRTQLSACVWSNEPHHTFPGRGEIHNNQQVKYWKFKTGGTFLEQDTCNCILQLPQDATRAGILRRAPLHAGRPDLLHLLPLDGGGIDGQLRSLYGSLIVFCDMSIFWNNYETKNRDHMFSVFQIYIIEYGGAVNIRNGGFLD